MCVHGYACVCVHVPTYALVLLEKICIIFLFLDDTVNNHLLENHP